MCFWSISLYLAMPMQRLLTGCKIFTKTIHRSFCAGLKMAKENRLVWFDGEMTGLDPKNSFFMEVACIVTDKDLNIIKEGPNIIIHQPEQVLNTMDPWCIEQHRKSGLTKKCLESKINVEEAQQQLLDFITPLTDKGKCYLAGNTIYMDKLFLMHYMPKFVDHLHYRLFDVSAIKLCSVFWFNNEAPKVRRHRALDDIKESIEELKYYKNRIFK